MDQEIIEKIHPQEILKVDHVNGIYFTIIDDMIFYNNHIDFETHIKRGKGTQKIFELTCLNHNFTPFKQGKRFYAIGGQDNWKVDKKWRNLNYSKFKAVFKDHFKREYEGGLSGFEVTKFKFDTTRHFPHCHGLYLLDSFDGVNWRMVKEGPIITVENKGFISALAWKSAEFDCKPSIVRFKDTWFLYLRANTNIDERQIQFATSKNLIDWSEFKLIEIDFKPGENYYHPVIIEHKKQLIGFFNYYDNDTSCIRIMKSTNGLRWKKLTNIFIEKPVEIEGGKKKIRSVACSIKNNKSYINLYMNHNYNQNDPNFKSYIIDYKISHRWLGEILRVH